MPAERSSAIDVVPVLEALRARTGMDVAYVSRFVHGEQVVESLSGDADALAVHVGKTDDLEGTFCQRVVDGRLPNVVGDVARHPGCASLIAKRATPIGAYLGVPLRSASGRLHGTLCLLAADPRADLGASEQALAEGFAGVLARALTADAERLATQAERARLAGVARHALRTPVMAVRFLAEDLAAGTVGTADAARALSGEAAALTELIDGLGRPTPEAPARRDDLGDLARRAIAEAVAAFDATDRVELRRGPGGLEGSFDARAVLRSLRDLVDNALRHSGTPGAIEVDVRRDGPTAVVEVIDHGVGIDSERREEVRARFWRASRAVEEDIRGIGFGLAGAQAVATAHEGTLTIGTTPGGGSTIALRLPLR